MAVKYFDWIARHAERTPSKLAAIDLGAERKFSYKSFDERIGRLAAYLRQSLGVARGDRVAVLAHNSTNTLEVQFACGRLAAIFLPLNNRLTLEELEFILGDAGPKVLVCDFEFEDIAANLGASFTNLAILKTGSGHSYEAAIEARLEPLSHEPVTHDDVATIMYTSGTTGRPKGAMITYGMNVWNAVNISPIAGIDPNTVALTTLPLFHTGGLNCYTNPVLHAGGTVVIMKIFDPSRSLNLLTSREYGLNLYFGVPSSYLFMSQCPEFADANFAGLTGGVGGASMPVALLEQYQSRGLDILQGYGMTETGPFVFCLGREDAALKIGSCGQSVMHTEVKVVDQNGDTVDRETAGELWVRGPNITTGYWNRPEANKTSFVDGWLNTGDIVRADKDGYYYIVDRSKDMYISGGENVYPAEVENVIFQINEVADVAVVGVPSDRWGETGRAFIVRKPGGTLDQSAIVAHCRAKLATFKCPAIVTFVEELPRTASGKVHKPTLRAF
jgi:fatty-acyl-CoA synthase